MSNMSPQEQLMLELINRARLDPLGEARRFGINLNEGVAAEDRISTSSKQALAGNDFLNNAAASHSSWMLSNDIFDHVEQTGTSGFTGRNPSNRTQNAGYSGNFIGENISVRGESGAISNADMTRLIKLQHADLFIDEGVAGRGHRTNIMLEDYREVGIGQQVGSFRFSGSGTFNSSMVTQDFGATGTNVFITGVVYNDTVINDNFFSVGEQTTGRTVSVGATTDTTGAGGGYELSLAPGLSRTVSFALASGTVTVEVGSFSSNVKLDIVNGDEVWSDADITQVSANVTELHALGTFGTALFGSSANQLLVGNSGGNVLDGAGGSDVLIGGTGKDSLTGGSGSDEFRFSRNGSSKSIATADGINDFTIGEDTIGLHLIDARTDRSGNQAFTFIGTAAFSDRAGELRTFQSNGDTFVAGDMTGDGNADIIVRVDGILSLSGSDFRL